MEKLISQIESTYGLKLVDFSPARRGFVAETYCLTTDKGKYFIKIIDNRRFAANLPKALPVQAKLAQRLDYIPAPIATLSGEFQWISSDNKAISLYTYFDGKPNSIDSDGNPHGSESDYSKLLPLAAGVYKSCVDCNIVETFPIWLETEFDTFLNGALPLSDEVSECVNIHRAFIQDKWRDYKHLCERLAGSDDNFYITHGDMPGNLMVDGNGKLYIVDWDDIKLAPIERDLWEYMSDDVNIQKITKMLADSGVEWTFSPDYYRYYLYTRFFDDLYGYMELDLTRAEDSAICARKIKTEVFDWLFPLMMCAG